MKQFTKIAASCLLGVCVLYLAMLILPALVVPDIVPDSGNPDGATAKLEMRSIGSALSLYRNLNGRYPTQDEGLAALVSVQHLKNVPLDPWGNAYNYELSGPSDEYSLSSFGADGVPGGVDENADLVHEAP